MCFNYIKFIWLSQIKRYINFNFMSILNIIWKSKRKMYTAVILILLLLFFSYLDRISTLIIKLSTNKQCLAVFNRVVNLKEITTIFCSILYEYNNCNTARYTHLRWSEEIYITFLPTSSYKVGKNPGMTEQLENNLKK